MNKGAKEPRNQGTNEGANKRKNEGTNQRTDKRLKIGWDGEDRDGGTVGERDGASSFSQYKTSTKASSNFKLDLQSAHIRWITLYSQIIQIKAISTYDVLEIGCAFGSCRNHDVNVLAKDSDFCFGDAETNRKTEEKSARL